MTEVEWNGATDPTPMLGHLSKSLGVARRA
jgi:hypothetical protein